jgi:hypothetical protein
VRWRISGAPLAALPTRIYILRAGVTTFPGASVAPWLAAALPQAAESVWGAGGNGAVNPAACASSYLAAKLSVSAG